MLMLTFMMMFDGVDILVVLMIGVWFVLLDAEHCMCVETLSRFRKMQKRKEKKLLRSGECRVFEF